MHALTVALKILRSAVRRSARAEPAALPSAVVATDPPADLQLTPINGDPRPISGWLTTFQLGLVVLDPFTNESSWLLETSGRILTHFSGGNCYAGFLVTGTAEEAREFLGPWADKLLTFADPDRTAVKALGLNEIPAFMHIRTDIHIAAIAEGWDPIEWRNVAAALAENLSWSVPLIPAPGDPSPYAGSAAAG